MIAFDRAFAESWERMRGQLFEPFVFGNWVQLGFVAWLASFVIGGTSFHFSFPLDGTSTGFGDWLNEIGLGAVLAGLLLVVLVIGLLFVLAFWIGSRAQFMFLDNVVHNRAAVVEPWRRFRMQGNDFFKVYTLLVSVPMVATLLLILAALLVFWPDLVTMRPPTFASLVPWIIALCLLVIFWIVWSIPMVFYRDLCVPLMVASGCTALDAISRLWVLVREKPGDCALYLLLRMALGMLFGLISVLVVLFTCCIGALPCLHQILTLPVWVFRQHFIVECFGDLAPAFRIRPSDDPPPLPG